MTSSSNPLTERGLDTTPLVYCVLQGHPASAMCEQFLRAASGWFTTPLVLLEARGILTKVYNVDPVAATQQLTQFNTVPVTVLDLDAFSVNSALQLADTHSLHLTDAVLLHLAVQHGAQHMATEDQHFAQVCSQHGIMPQSPLDAALRQQVATWEAANVPVKGMPRMLLRIHHWLTQADPQIAQLFWSHTGGGSHLP